MVNIVQSMECHVGNKWHGRVVVAVVQSLSRVWLFATLWTVACQAPHLWGFPGKNAGVGYHALLQGIFLTQGWTHVSCIGRQVLYHWVIREVPRKGSPVSLTFFLQLLWLEISCTLPPSHTPSLQPHQDDTWPSIRLTEDTLFALKRSLTAPHSVWALLNYSPLCLPRSASQDQP